MTKTKKLSIIGMIFMTVFLLFMDLKDIYSKINMCGPYPTFLFLLTSPETVTNYDLTNAIQRNNGTWLSPVNQWNALALQCDSLFPSMLPPGKPAHLSSMGVGCTLRGVKRPEETMFVGVHRIDVLFWATGLLADIIDYPLLFPASWTSGYYGMYFNVNERLYRNRLAAIVNSSDVPAIRTEINQVFSAFSQRTGLWDKVLCYEITPMAKRGEKTDHVLPAEIGCIYTNMHMNETVAVVSSILSKRRQSLDYLSAGSGIYLRGYMYMKTAYSTEHTPDGQRLFWHYCQTDLGFDGVLSSSSSTPQMSRLSLVHSTVTSSIYTTMDSKLVSSKKLSSTTTMAAASSRVLPTPKPQDVEKTNTLSKMLLYTDLASVSYRKPLLAVLLVLDAVIAWIYIVPNAYVIAWASSAYQLGSAYLITELTHITSFEIMASTLLAIYLTFDDIMNVSILKGGLVDKQRGLTPTTPTILSFYAAYSRYSWGDQSQDLEALAYIYRPLGTIIQYGLLFSFLVLLTRLLMTVAFKVRKGTLGGEIETFWRSYQRNSAEVFMNDPLRANALIRSQHAMSYRFGKAVFIRPFVYLEQNYYITRGRFRQRLEVPFLHNEDSSNGAEVDTASYMLHGVFRDENSHRLQTTCRSLCVEASSQRRQTRQ